MPVCIGCAASYGNDFKFCPFCGRAKPEPQALKVEISVSSADRWETCRIETRVEPNGNGRSGEYVGGYWAQAIGPSGKYLAGESPAFHDSEGYSGKGVAHTFLVNQLTKAGWEALPSTGDWWATQFRRQIRDGYPKPWQVWVTKIAKQYGGLIICRFPETTRGKPNLLSGSLDQYEVVGSSDQIKLGFFEADESIKETSDRRRILDGFIARLVSQQGCEQVDDVENEELKKCFASNTKPLWYHRVLLRRK